MLYVASSFEACVALCLLDGDVYVPQVVPSQRCLLWIMQLQSESLQRLCTRSDNHGLVTWTLQITMQAWLIPIGARLTTETPYRTCLTS